MKVNVIINSFSLFAYLVRWHAKNAIARPSATFNCDVFSGTQKVPILIGLAHDKKNATNVSPQSDRGEMRRRQQLKIFFLKFK